MIKEMMGSYTNHHHISWSFFDPTWMFDVLGFDMIITNPPYIGHKGGAKFIFRALKETSLGKRFNQERMDLFYYFFLIHSFYLLLLALL